MSSKSLTRRGHQSSRHELEPRAEPIENVWPLEVVEVADVRSAGLELLVYREQREGA